MSTIGPINSQNGEAAVAGVVIVAKCEIACVLCGSRVAQVFALSDGTTKLTVRVHVPVGKGPMSDSARRILRPKKLNYEQLADPRQANEAWCPKHGNRNLPRGMALAALANKQAKIHA